MRRRSRRLVVVLAVVLLGLPACGRGEDRPGIVTADDRESSAEE